jgi:hypothetical protein
MRRWPFRIVGPPRPEATAVAGEPPWALQRGDAMGQEADFGRLQEQRLTSTGRLTPHGSASASGRRSIRRIHPRSTPSWTGSAVWVTAS